MKEENAIDIKEIWIRNKKRVSLLHRAATTKYPCCDQALGGSSGAGRVGLTQPQRYINLFQIQKTQMFFYYIF
ncbi:MAG: hypothetical protein PHI32_13985 [Dysgonamonadaceae bacterium]|nr:hypothetical protein [Dysgonamonadaceae bacterium]MDD4728022.1 hypothetical protein [Dysgonamonadaceae bacterium]